MNKATKKENTDEIQKIIDESSNKLHSEVVSFLRDKEWSVLISPYYNDNQTGKSREIDIIAEKKFDIHTDFDGRLGYLFVQLFIECKYINNNVVFWFDNKNLTAAEEMIVRNTCLKPSNENVTIQKHHNFKNNQVAKLFASSSDPNKLTENENFYKALNQTLNGMVYYRKQGGIIVDRKPVRPEYKLYIVHYPIIMCNNFEKIFRVNIGNTNYENVNESDFELETNYSYRLNDNKNQDEYFLIDVIDFTKFENYLNKLTENDIAALKECVYYSNY